MNKRHENPWQMVAILGTLSLEILFLTVGGAWLGRQLDAIYHTKSIFLIIGIFLGLGFGFASAAYTFKKFIQH